VEAEHDRGDEHQVTPLELFFDLVFVFAITQVTRLLADDPTWGGVLRGMLVLAALWWLYFDVAAIIARTRLVQAAGLEQARDAYNYLHLPMVAAIVLFALGLKTTIGDVGDTLDTVPAVALCGGAALYLLGHITFLYRATGYLFRRRTIGAALIPAALAIPALAALALVSAVCSLVVAYEVIRYRTARVQVRHPELAA
jgi:low temperature requirement protein LtrA